MEDNDEPDLHQKGRVTVWLVTATAVATLCGSFQCGYQLGVMTGPSMMIQDFYNQSNYERRGEHLSESAQLWLWSTSVSLLSIGGAVGALASGFLADYFGRRGAMLVVNFFSISGGLLMGLSYVANAYEMVIIGRFLSGIYAGSSLALVALYLAEISPVNLRGAVGVNNQLFLSVGILIAQVLGLYLFDYDTGWPILLALPSVISVIQLVVFPFCPESPRWLFVNKGREEEAEKALKRLRGTNDVSAELKELRNEVEDSKNTKKVGVWTLISMKNPAWRRPLVMSVCLFIGQQFTGIGVIIYYATEIFYQTGMDDTQVGYATVGMGAVLTLMTLGAVFVVDPAGRRPLLVYPYAVMSATTGLLTISLNLQEKTDGWKWLSLILIFAFLIAFSGGSGPVTGVLVAELWAQGPRPTAVSIAVQINWLANFTCGLAFPYLQETLGPYAFLVFMVCSLITTILIYIYVPETKGRTFRDIAAGFGHQDNDGSPEENQRMNPSYQKMS